MITNNILKASTIFVQHIKEMKESKWASVRTKAFDMELFYNTVIEQAEIMDATVLLLKANSKGGKVENEVLLRHYSHDMDYLIRLCLKLAKRLGDESIEKEIIDNLFIKGLDVLENNHN